MGFQNLSSCVMIVSNISLIASSLVMSLYILFSCSAFVNFSSSASDFLSSFSSSAISGLK